MVSGGGRGGVHPIEVESYRILEERIDLSHWPEPERTVVARVIHATADLDYAGTMRIGEDAITAAVAALRAGAPVVCDAHMLRAGITKANALCLLDEVPEAPPGGTRSAEAFRRAAERYPTGAIWAVGNAPTALDALLDLHEQGRAHPAAIVGLPVGFVGAKESKSRLWQSPLRPLAITNEGEKAGSAAAAAAVNALTRLTDRPV